MIEPVDRFHADAAFFAALLDVERHRRARGPRGPDLAVEVREAARRLAANADDFVTLADPGLFAGPARRHARHHQVPAHVVGRDPKPGTSRTRDMTVGDQVA